MTHLPDPARAALPLNQRRAWPWAVVAGGAALASLGGAIAWSATIDGGLGGLGEVAAPAGGAVLAGLALAVGGAAGFVSPRSALRAAGDGLCWRRGRERYTFPPSAVRRVVIARSKARVFGLPGRIWLDVHAAGVPPRLELGAVQFTGAGRLQRAARLAAALDAPLFDPIGAAARRAPPPVRWLGEARGWRLAAAVLGIGGATALAVALGAAAHLGPGWLAVALLAGASAAIVAGGLSALDVDAAVLARGTLVVRAAGAGAQAADAELSLRDLPTGALVAPVAPTSTTLSAEYLAPLIEELDLADLPEQARALAAFLARLPSDAYEVRWELGSDVAR
jgi:hypothetical protein